MLTMAVYLGVNVTIMTFRYLVKLSPGGMVTYAIKYDVSAIFLGS